MNILMQPNREILAVIKPQLVFNDKEYRLLTNCLITNVNGGKLLFNGLTRCFVFLTNEEFEDIYNKERFLFLYRYYFLVPKDFDEIKIIDEVREHFKIPIDDFYLKNPIAYTILTTTKCNARCFYCYERKLPKKHMSEETAHKIAKYISQKAPRNQQVELRWFGGEPLWNNKVIDIITNDLRNVGIKFNSSFTSNGYLFDQEMVIKAKSAWNTSSIQITIDGTENIYNKAKNYIHKNVNPYKRVMNNIALLLNAGIAVTVRMNVDQYNGDDLQVLVKELHTRFGNHPRFGVYCWPIFEDANYSRTEEQRVEVFKKIAEIEKVMEELGYYRGQSPSPMIAFKQCMVDNGRSITISPNGELGLCEHFVNSDFWGNLDSEERDVQVFESWREYEKPLDICKDCPLYGDCIRPSKCEEMSKCDIHYKNWKIRKATIGLKNAYYKSLNNQSQIPAPLIPVQKEEEVTLKSMFKQWIKSKL